MSYNAFHQANNKGADQTARMRRLICAFVVRKQQSAFLAAMINNNVMNELLVVSPTYAN